MKASLLKSAGVLVLVLGALAGCESDGGSTSVHGSVYYGVGFYDPYYYGPGYYPPDVIVTPPPNQPGRPDSPPRPAHPIATPPTTAPRPTPMPSIPSTPRPVARGRR